MDQDLIEKVMKEVSAEIKAESSKAPASAPVSDIGVTEFVGTAMGHTYGCVIANLINVAVSGMGALGMLDVVFGSLATLLGSLWCRKFRDRPALAIFGFVLANALIVPAYLPILLQGLGYYTIPFPSIALDGMYLPMYLFGVVATGIGEAIVIYALGLPLLRALKRAGIGEQD